MSFITSLFQPLWGIVTNPAVDSAIDHAMARANATPARLGLVQLHGLLSDLVEQMKDNFRPRLLQAVTHAKDRLNDLLSADEAQCFKNIKIIFTPKDNARPYETTDDEISGIIQQLKNLRSNLLKYEAFLTGKKAISKKDLHDFRESLIKGLQDNYIENLSTDDLPTINWENLTKQEQEELQELTTPGNDQPPIDAQENSFVEMKVIKAKYRLLDYVTDVKKTTEGQSAEALQQLFQGAKDQAHATVSSFFGGESAVSRDHIDIPPKELVQIQKNGEVITMVRLNSKPTNLFSQIIEIFSEKDAIEQKRRISIIWKNILSDYLLGLIDQLSTNQEDESTGQADLAKELKGARAYLEQLTDESTSANISDAFHQCGEILRRHPIDVFNRPIDLSELLQNKPSNPPFSEISHEFHDSASKSSAQVQDAPSEKSGCEGNLKKTQRVTTALAFYGTVVSLLKIGGNVDEETINFHTIWQSIVQKRDGLERPFHEVYSDFEDKIRTQVIDQSHEVLFIWRWTIKLFLPILSLAIQYGVYRFVESLKSYLTTLLDTFEENRPYLIYTFLSRVIGVARSIESVAKNKKLQQDPGGPDGIFKIGLLINPTNRGISEDAIYDEFTRWMVDQFFSNPIRFKEALNQYEQNIKNMIDQVPLSFLRTTLSVASLSIRIPMWIVGACLIQPVQTVGNWLSTTLLKKILVYSKVLHSTMDNCKLAFAKKQTKSIQTNPLIDRSVLNFLDNLWEIVKQEKVNNDQEPYEANPEHTERVGKTITALSDAITAVQDVNSGKSEIHRPAFYEDIAKAIRTRSHHIGVEASSSVTLSVIHAMTEPSMLWHLLSTSVSSLNESLSGEKTFYETDEQRKATRNAIRERVEDLINLSVHRARKLTEGPSITAVDKAINEKIISIQTELEKKITRWTEVINAYDKENLTPLFEIKAEVQQETETRKKELSALSNDSTINSTSRTAFDKELGAPFLHLSRFWKTLNDKLIIIGQRNHLLCFEQEEEMLKASKNIQRLLDLYKSMHATFKTESNSPNAFNWEYWETSQSLSIELIRFFGQLKDKLSQSINDRYITDDLQKVLDDMEVKKGSFDDLHTQLQSHKRFIDLYNALLGKNEDGWLDHNFIGFDLQKCICEENNLQQVRYYVKDVKKALSDTIKPLKLTGSEEYKGVMRNLATINISEDVTSFQNPVNEMKEALTVLCIKSQNSCLASLKSIIQVLDGLHTTFAKEIAQLPSDDSLAIFESLITEAKEHLAQAKKSTQELKTIQTVQIANQRFSFPTEWMINPIIEAIRKELTEKSNSFYSMIATDSDIVTFAILRLLLIPLVEDRLPQPDPTLIRV